MQEGGPPYPELGSKPVLKTNQHFSIENFVRDHAQIYYKDHESHPSLFIPTKSRKTETIQ